MNVSAQPNNNIGYWPEALGLILKGEKKLTREEVHQCAEILYQNHRVYGNPHIPKCLKNDERRIEAIENLWTAYVELKDQTELVERAKLLDTVFMVKLAKNDDCHLSSLSADKQKYVLNDSIPSALQAVDAEYLMTIDQCKTWIEQYRLACTFPARDALEIHMELFAGYSEEEKKKLTDKRASISQGWYGDGFKNNKVTKLDIRDLYKKIQNFIENNKLDIFDNPYMGRAFYGYIIHAEDFPAEKQTLYWEAILSALDAFILKGR